MEEKNRDVLLKEYAEVCSNFRLLTDIRFKLLTFLPIASVAGLAVMEWKNADSGFQGALISLFGLVVTLGLITYNARNDQLYNELVGRAAAIERRLGLRDGAFANRPRAWLSIPLAGTTWRVEHGTGVTTIYTAIVVLWLYGLGLPVFDFVRGACLQAGASLMPSPETWTKIGVLVLAILLTCGVLAWLKRVVARRERDMRFLANLAIVRAEELGLPDAAVDKILADLCVRLSGLKPEVVEARAAFYCVQSSAVLGQYVPLLDSELQKAVQFVANLTDLPPEWLLDTYTDRKGSRKAAA